MYTVLLPVDSDDVRATSAAQSVMELPGESKDIEVIILNVFEEFETTGEGPKISSDELYDQTEPPKSVRTTKKLLEDQSISVSVKRKHGSPSQTIIKFANEIDADLIALTTRKRSPTGKVIFGSVTQAVLLSSDIPVLAVSTENTV
jgi:nucleotide-binding universal stress UspA family protein